MLSCIISQTLELLFFFKKIIIVNILRFPSFLCNAFSHLSTQIRLKAQTAWLKRIQSETLTLCCGVFSQLQVRAPLQRCALLASWMTLDVSPAAQPLSSNLSSALQVRTVQLRVRARYARACVRALQADHQVRCLFARLAPCFALD